MRLPRLAGSADPRFVGGHARVELPAGAFRPCRRCDRMSTPNAIERLRQTGRLLPAEGAGAGGAGAGGAGGGGGGVGGRRGGGGVGGGGGRGGGAAARRSAAATYSLRRRSPARAGFCPTWSSTSPARP